MDDDKSVMSESDSISVLYEKFIKNKKEKCFICNKEKKFSKVKICDDCLNTLTKN